MFERENKTPAAVVETEDPPAIAFNTNKGDGWRYDFTYTAPKTANGMKEELEFRVTKNGDVDSNKSGYHFGNLEAATKWARLTLVQEQTYFVSAWRKGDGWIQIPCKKDKNSETYFALFANTERAQLVLKRVTP